MRVWRQDGDDSEAMPEDSWIFWVNARAGNAQLGQDCALRTHPLFPQDYPTCAITKVRVVQYTQSSKKIRHTCLHSFAGQLVFQGSAITCLFKLAALPEIFHLRRAQPVHCIAAPPPVLPLLLVHLQEKLF
jgi:hypothetical protein